LNGAVPVAVTLNVAVCPTVTVTLAGWATIVGAIVFVPPFEVEETDPAQPATASAATTALNGIRKVGRRTGTTPKSKSAAGLGLSRGLWKGGPAHAGIPQQYAHSLGSRLDTGEANYT